MLAVSFSQLMAIYGPLPTPLTLPHSLQTDTAAQTLRQTCSSTSFLLLTCRGANSCTFSAVGVYIKIVQMKHAGAGLLQQTTPKLYGLPRPCLQLIFVIFCRRLRSASPVTSTSPTGRTTALRANAASCGSNFLFDCSHTTDLQGQREHRESAFVLIGDRQ